MLTWIKKVLSLSHWKMRNSLWCFAEQIEQRSKNYFFSFSELEYRDGKIYFSGYWEGPIYTFTAFVISENHPDIEKMKSFRTGDKVGFSLEKNKKKSDSENVSDLLRFFKEA